MVFRYLAAMLAALGVAHVYAGELQGFSFEYQITGDRSIAPFQVFDDGTATFLQFRDPAKVPAIFVREAEGSRLVTPEPQGNYLRIAGLVQRLELVGERKSAAVVSLRKHLVPAPALPRTAFLPADPGAMVPVAPGPPVPQPTIAYGPAAHSAASAPPPLYARAPVRAEPTATSIRPGEIPQDHLAEVRGQLEQLRQVLDVLTSRLLRAAATRSAPPRHERDAMGPPDLPRLHPARAERALDAPAPVGTAEREKVAAFSGRHVAGNGSGHGSAHVAAGSLASERAASAAPIRSGDTMRTFVFEVEPGQRLSEAVRRFVSSHRLELDWDTGGADYEIRYGFRVLGGTVDEVLFGVLSPFKLSAVTRRGNNVVAVSRAA